MGTQPLQPLFLLDDEPIRSHRDDKLEHDRYARLIAETALGTTGPFTIGVYGGWGQGKTSLLKHAKDLLDQRKDGTSAERLHPQVATVFFNAWRYEREAHPIVPLVATIASEVQKRIEADATLTQKAGDKVRRWWGKIVDASEAVITTMKAEVSGSLGTAATGQVGGKINVDGAAAKKAYDEKQAAREQADDLSTQPWIKQSLYLSAFDDLESLWDEELSNLKDPANPAPRLVIFIDDLDRCQPEKAFELLEGIKLALAQPGFIFVLALNADIITRYLANEAKKRYGDNPGALGDRYLDKIVQLAVPLRSHKRAFPKFIQKTVTDTLAKTLSAPGRTAINPFSDAVLQLKDLLGRFTQHTPRTLIRRLNSLIVDERLLPADAPFRARAANETVMDHAARRRSYYMGLLLVQRTLIETPGVTSDDVRYLHEEPALCEAVDKQGLEELFDALKAMQSQQERRSKEIGAGANVDAKARATAKQDAKWMRLLSPFRGREEVAELFRTEPGKHWLMDHKARQAVVDLVADQPTPQEPAQSGTTPPSNNDRDEALAREIAIIHRAARGSLKLDDKAPLGASELARVKELDLSGEPVTDAGAAWLAAKDSPLTALTTLNLSLTKITDQGLAHLAVKDAPLTALTTLNLYGTQITDQGLAYLAAKDSPLTALTTLDLGGTKITDQGLEHLAAKDSPLTGLTTLHLGGTQITDQGLAHLAAKGSRLTALTTLNLYYTHITDQGLAHLAAKDSPLTALTALYLRVTEITDQGLAPIKRRFPNIAIMR
ncbi:MAG TPA: P-loop NTPase fold protein [Phycisphaerales bacterium]|nr:P-loop NTPase fold protein [Phycisphaerales bacterium]